MCTNLPLISIKLIVKMQTKNCIKQKINLWRCNLLRFLYIFIIVEQILAYLKRKQTNNMKKLIVIICLIISGFLFLPETSCASHLVGAEIEYVYMGTPNVYLFKLKVYRDCNGIPMNVPQDLCLSSFSLNFATSIILNLISQTVIPNSPCINLPPTNCTGGLGQGFEEYIFEGVDTLPNAATDWLFSWSSCCRNIASTTILNPSSVGMYVSATLDNFNHPTDDSPIFNFIPYSTLCLGVPYFYNQGAVDPNGDSLVFSLVSAQENSSPCPPSAINASYIPPYSPTYPLSSSVPITIDPTTGIIYFIPNLQQIALICVLVSSYDSNGVMIGTTKSDIQIVITNQCNIVNPAFPGGPNSSYFTIGDPAGQVPGPYYCGDNKFVLPFSEAVQCNSISPTDFRVLRSLGFPNPVISAVPLTCINGRADSIEITCLYPLTSGTNLVTIKTGTDGNTLLSQCGSAMQPFHDTVAIIINDFSSWQPVIDSLGCVFNHKTLTFNEQLFCYTIANDGSDLLLKDAAGTTTIPVTNAYGYCSPNGEQSNQMLMTFANMQTPTSAVYYLTVKTGNDGNTIANECGRFLNVGDTLAIFYINSGIDVDLGADRSICNGDPASILTSGFSDHSFTYQWSFNASIISGAINPIYAAINGAGAYGLAIYMNSNPGCKGSDTIQVTVNVSPVVSINDTMVCVGTTIILDAGNNGLGYQYQWYRSGPRVPTR